MQKLGHSHRIDKRSLALEAVSSPLADLDKEVVKGDTENKNLQDLLSSDHYQRSDCVFRATYRVHVTHIASVNKSARLDEGDLLGPANRVPTDSLSK